MNKAMLIGRLTKDPELKTTQTGKSLCNFTLAVDRRFKQEGQPTADFINVVAWNKQAEVICQYVTKGQQIGMTGRINTRNYDDKDGKKVYVTEIILEEFYFISNKASTNKSSSGNSKSASGSQSNEPASVGLDDDDFFLMAEGDECPF